MEPRLSHLENRVDAAYHGEDDPAPHLTSDLDLVSSLPVGTERRLGELGEDDFEIPYLVPPVEAGARETQVKQDRPVSRKVPFQWTCSQLCGAWCTCTVPALAALCSSQWTRTLSAEYFRPQVLSAHHLSRGQGQISVNPASVYVLSGCGPHLSRTSQRPPGSGAHCPSNLWFQSARVSFASECVPKRKSSRYGLGVSNKRKSLPFFRVCL